MAKNGLPTEYKYKTFLSYSTDPDYSLVRKLESFLETFHTLKTPADLPLKSLKICLDGSDFSIQQTHKKEGAHAVASLIDSYLSQSAELLVLCSRKAKESPWVDQEVQWFLKHRGPDSIRLAVTEGKDPGAEPTEIFSNTIIEAGLHLKPWYDFREAKGSSSVSWRKVKKYDDERTRLAADLNDVSAGDIQPIWYRQQRRIRKNRILATLLSTMIVLIASVAAVYFGIVAKKEEGLKYISDAYKVLYRDPSQAVLKAYRGHQLLPGQESEAALKTAFKVAVLHYYNRRENDRITGWGPSYLAGRWRRGDVFTENSPDGLFKLLVTERGEDGPRPPGEVYLFNNETLRVTKLEPCVGRMKRRVEAVSFDRSSKHIFVTRQFDLSVYTTTGACAGGYLFSRHTKSPVHLAEGFFNEKYVLGSETKGGLWLVVPHQVETRSRDKKDAITLQNEFHGDPAMSVVFSQDGKKGVLVFESGRSAVLFFDQSQNKLVLSDLAKEKVQFASFYPGNEDQIITTGKDGVVRIWQINDGKTEEIQNIPVSDTALDWVTLSEDGRYMLAAGTSPQLYIVDVETKKLLSVVDYRDAIDWSLARALSAKNESVALRVDRAVPSVKNLGDPSLRVIKSLAVEGEKWLLASADKVNHIFGGKPYRIEGNSAVSYPSFPGNVSSIEKVGDYYWFKNGPLYSFVPGGLQVVPGKDVFVIDVLQHGKDSWLATNKGLYRLRDNVLIRLSDDKLQVKKIYLLDGQIYLATNRSVYVIENEMIIGLTDRFGYIKEIRSINGKIWVLDEIGRGFVSGCRLYLVDGRFSRRIGNYDFGVTDIFEARGKTWLASAKGFFQYHDSELKEVANIKGIVTGITDEGSRLVLATRGNDLLGWPSASYELDEDLLIASPLGVVERQWKNYGGEYLALKKIWDITQPKAMSSVVVRREGNREIEINLKDAVVESIEEVNGQAWVLTDKGVYRILGGLPEKYEGIDLPIKSLLKQREDVWLLSTSAVILVDDQGHQLYDLDNYTSREFKEIAGDIWILTGMSTHQPGPAFRIRNNQIQQINGPFGAVKNVVVINNQVWLTTVDGKQPGPMFHVLD